MKIGAGKMVGAALAMAAFMAGCSDRRPTDPRVADATRPLVMLTYPTVPPCSYFDENGEIVGTDIDMARRIASKMGRELVVEGVRFNDIILRLKAGTADFAIATIIITEARLRDVDFSVPYDKGGACFLYKADGRKPRMSQLFALRVGVESDSVHDLYICRHGGDPVRFVNLEAAISALEKDAVDAVFFDSVQLMAKAEESGGRFAVTQLETKDWYGVAVDKRRPDVLAAANAVIEEGSADCRPAAAFTRSLSSAFSRPSRSRWPLRGSSTTGSRSAMPTRS